jgi:hypothetical protein
VKVMGFFRCRQRSKSFKEAYPPSATATIWRCGYQRLTTKSICQAHSVRLLWRLPHSSFAWRSEYARAERKGRAHTLEAHGTSAKSTTQIHLSGLVFTK